MQLKSLMDEIFLIEFKEKAYEELSRAVRIELLDLQPQGIDIKMYFSDSTLVSQGHVSTP